MNYKCLLTIALLASILSGCATVLTERAKLSASPNGVRIYPPKTYLFVNSAKNKTNVYILPDYENAYDVKPLTIVAKQDFKIEIEETGILKSFSTNQDTTSIVDLLKAAAGIAKEAAAPGSGSLTQNSFDGTFGLQDGIYYFSENGLVKLNTDHLPHWGAQQTPTQ